jgi:Ser/Thr protein kinase RdoA (MazF antagonist)
LTGNHDLISRGVIGLRHVGAYVNVTEILIDFEHRVVYRAVSPRDGVRFIVKVHRRANAFSGEEHALGRAAAGGCCVPPVVMSNARPPSILVMADLPGCPLTESASRACWNAAGEELPRLHGIALGELRRFDQCGQGWRDFVSHWATTELDRTVRCGLIGSVLAHALRRTVVRPIREAPEPDRCFLHGDCKPDHILLTGGVSRPALVDFGNSGTGDPVWDLVVLTLSEADPFAVVEGYRPAAGTTQRLLSLGHAYRIIRHSCDANWLFEHGYDPARDVRRLTELADGDERFFAPR